MTYFLFYTLNTRLIQGCQTYLWRPDSPETLASLESALLYRTCPNGTCANNLSDINPYANSTYANNNPGFHNVDSTG